jgi:exonuclease SbcD
MRFIHTADWHLGRSFFNISLIEDQTYVLNQLIDIARDVKPDVMIIAGDIYDRALPPIEAIELFDDVLCRLILELELPVILIGGNHDSPLRIEFAARLMETLRLHIFGSLTGRIRSIDIPDMWGNVTFLPLPYSEPVRTREYFNIEEINTFEDAMRQWNKYFKDIRPTSERTVLIHHAFVAGSQASDSERPIDIGGIETIPVNCFNDFDYVALGHLHRPQSIGQKDHIHYSGSLLKYSFSEANQNKGIKLVEMDANGRCQIEFFTLTPKHDVRCVEGSLEDLLKGKTTGSNREDYLQVNLQDKGAVFDAMNRLRDIYPNITSIEHTNVLPPGTATIHMDHRERELIQLFQDFYQQVTGEELTGEQSEAFSEIANQVKESERSE